jgi:hypothetical protein
MFHKMLNEEEVGLASFSFKVFEFFIIIDKSLIDPGNMSDSRIVGVLEAISDAFDSVTFVSFFL